MVVSPSSQLLRTILNIDALACGAMGIALIAAPGFLGNWTELPVPLLFWAGVLLLPVAMFIAGTARFALGSNRAITVVIVGNYMWAAVSLALPLAGICSPNMLGWILLGGQAVLVALLALAELTAAKRTLAFA